MVDGTIKENAVVSEPTKQYAEGAVRLYTEGANLRTEIDIPQGTVIILKRTPTPQKLSPFESIAIRKGEKTKPILAIAPDYSQGLDTYKFLGPETNDNVGVAQGKQLDLALAYRLGVQDPNLERDAGQHLVDPGLITRIKTSFLTLEKDINLPPN